MAGDGVAQLISGAGPLQHCPHLVPLGQGDCLHGKPVGGWDVHGQNQIFAGDGTGGPLQQSQRLRGEGVQGVVQDDQEGGLVVYRVGGQAVVGVVSACVVIAPEQVYRDRRGALNEGVGLAVKVLVALGHQVPGHQDQAALGAGQSLGVEGEHFGAQSVAAWISQNGEGRERGNGNNGVRDDLNPLGDQRRVGSLHSSSFRCVLPVSGRRFFGGAGGGSKICA